MAVGGAPAPGAFGGGPAFVLTLLLALGLVSAGLVSSAFHLGRPERALLAFTQWRTSWLSREACLAVATCVPAVALGAGWWIGEPGGAWRYLGLPLAAGALATVYSTAMIYRSLAAVPRWSSPWVPVNYLTLAAASGAVWLAFVAVFFDPETAAGFAGFAAGLLVLAATAKGGYWRAIGAFPGRARSRAPPASPPGRGCAVCAFSIRRTRSPTGCNGEMGYRVARRHARKLRALTWALAFVLPAALCLVVGLGGGSEEERRRRRRPSDSRW